MYPMRHCSSRASHPFMVTKYHLQRVVVKGLGRQLEGSTDKDGAMLLLVGCEQGLSKGWLLLHHERPVQCKQTKRKLNSSTA